MNKEQNSVSLPLFGIPRLLPFLRPYRARMFRMVFLALICSVIDVSYPLFNRYALDHFIAGKTLHGLPLFIALYLGVVVFQNLINFRSMYDSSSTTEASTCATTTACFITDVFPSMRTAASARSISAVRSTQEGPSTIF